MTTSKAIAPNSGHAQYLDYFDDARPAHVRIRDLDDGSTVWVYSPEKALRELQAACNRRRAALGAYPVYLDEGGPSPTGDRLVTPQGGPTRSAADDLNNSANVATWLRSIAEQIGSDVELTLGTDDGIGTYPIGALLEMAADEIQAHG